MSQDINQNYDEKLKANLEKRLNRPAKPHEVINADFDSDLVNETLWQLILEMDARLQAVEKKKGVL